MRSVRVFTEKSSRFERQPPRHRKGGGAQVAGIFFPPGAELRRGGSAPILTRERERAGGALTPVCLHTTPPAAPAHLRELQRAGEVSALMAAIRALVASRTRVAAARTAAGLARLWPAVGPALRVRHDAGGFGQLASALVLGMAGGGPDAAGAIRSCSRHPGASQIAGKAVRQPSADSSRYAPVRPARNVRSIAELVGLRGLPPAAPAGLTGGAGRTGLRRGPGERRGTPGRTRIPARAGSRAARARRRLRR